MIDRNACKILVALCCLFVGGNSLLGQELELGLPPLPNAEVVQDSGEGFEEPLDLIGVPDEHAPEGLPGNAKPLETSQWQIHEMNLASSSAVTRARAAADLAQLGSEAEPTLDSLYERLSDPDAEVRRSAAHALGSIGGQIVDSVERLVPVLNDPDEHVRYGAEWSLAKLCVQPFPKTDVERMLEALIQGNKILLSRSHHQGHQSVIEQVIAELKPSQPQPMELPQVAPEPVPTAAARTLRDELLALPAEYEMGDLITQLLIIDRLTEVPDSSLQGVLFDVRKDIFKQSMLRSQAPCLFFALHRWGQAGHLVAMQLFDDLQTSNLPTWSCDLLYEVRPRNLSDVRKLLAIVESPNPAIVAEAAAEALGRAKETAAVAPEILSIVFNDERPLLLRVELLRAMATYARRDAGVAFSSEIQSRLVELLSSENVTWELRLQAARTLVALDSGDERASGTFAAVATRSRLLSYELAAALDVLEGFDRFPTDATDLLHQGLKCEDELGKLSGLRILRRLAMQGRPEVDSCILELFVMFADPEESPLVLAQAAQVLAAVGPESLRGLGEQLCLFEEPCRINALKAVASLGEDGLPCFDACVQVLESSEHSSVSHAAAALTLASMGSRARGSSPTLKRILLESECEAARSAALMALVQIGQADIQDAQAAIEQSNEPTWPVTVALATHAAGGPDGVRRLAWLLGNEITSRYAADALQDIGSGAGAELMRFVGDSGLHPVHRVTAMETLLRLPNPNYDVILPWVQDESIGDACADCLSGHQSQAHGDLLEGLVAMVQTNESPMVQARLRKILESQLGGLGAGGEEYLDFGSYLATDLLHEAEANRVEELRVAQAFTFEEANKPATETRPLLVQKTESPVAPGPAVIPSLETEGQLADAGGNQQDAQQDGGSLAAALPMPQALREEVEIDDGQRPTVSVFYGTNRKPLGAEIRSWSRAELIQKCFAFFVVGVIVVVWAAGRFRQKLVLYALAGLVICVLSLNVLGITDLRISAPESIAENGEYYGGEYSDELKLGVCQVTVPEHHQYGELESASILKLEFQKDPTKHVYLADVNEVQPNIFYSQLNQELEVKGKQLLVFIHGYNVTFDDAARRSAQLAHDLKFPGAPVFYSWPSRGNWYKYRLDRKNIELSVVHIKRFLTDLAERSNASSIHLVAHSMGNVGLTEALSEMDNPASGPRFNQVVLAAPDIDADIFRTRIAPKIVSKAERCTVYTSKEDLALIASRYFNAGNRVGETLPQQPYPGVDFVDASEVDTSLLGHSYYGNASLLRDLDEVLKSKPLTERTFVRASDVGGIPAWYVDSPYMERENKGRKTFASTKGLSAVEALLR